MRKKKNLDKKLFTFYLDKKIKDKFKIVCVIENTSMGCEIEAFMKQYVNERIKNDTTSL